MDERLVKKAARVLLATPGDWPGPEREQEWAEYLMHSVLTTILPDMRREVAEGIAQQFDARCQCYARTHPNHAHDCAIRSDHAAEVVRGQRDPLSNARRATEEEAAPSDPATDTGGEGHG